MVALVGLDLAWTVYRPSGVCVLEADRAGSVRLVELGARVLPDAGATADWLCELGGELVAAIDAPLLVGAPRLAERALNRVYGRFHAGAYSANLDFLTRMGGMAGPDLGAALITRGVSVSPPAPGAVASPARWAFEMYPHAAHIELFSLPMRLAYKKGRIAARRLAFREYQGHLEAVLARELPALLDDAAIRALLEPTAIACGGRALKAVEDQLDALTCAIVAHHAWRHGTAGLTVFGDELGYIVVPRLVP